MGHEAPVHVFDGCCKWISFRLGLFVSLFLFFGGQGRERAQTLAGSSLMAARERQSSIERAEVNTTREPVAMMDAVAEQLDREQHDQAPPL